MPNTENTFADRLGRAESLSAALNAFSPAFTPADATLTPAAFTTFLADLTTLNGTTNSAKDDSSTAANERQARVKDLKARALRAFRYVQSNAAWAKNAASLKLTYDKLRANRSSKPKLPTEGTTAALVKAVRLSEQSYADLDSLFSKFVGALSKIVGYAPPAAELQLATLQTLSTDFHTQNQALAALAETAALSVRDRQAGFEALRVKSKAIKQAVSAQYGPQSAQYTSIKGLAF